MKARSSPVEIAAPQQQKTKEDLTDREREILTRIAEGLTNLKIAGDFGISVRTVEFHRANLMRKLGIRDHAGLIKFAIREGLIGLD